MPLTAKGSKIKTAMKKQYGTAKGKQFVAQPKKIARKTARFR